MNIIAIHKAEQENQQILEKISVVSRSKKPDEYFRIAFDRQKQRTLDIFLASIDGVLCGYCFLNYEPKYVAFLKQQIPEIQDLNVDPGFRKRGVASALIEHCEKLALSHGHQHMGIGVGLDPSYGPAQILYAQKGYIPDGAGICHDRATVRVGDIRAVDDDLCLMMIKELR